MSTQAPICQQCQLANKHAYKNTSQGWVCDDCTDTVSEAELSDRLTTVERAELIKHKPVINGMLDGVE